MAVGSYLPMLAVATAPFGKSVKLRQCGQVVDITGWSATLTISDYPGGPTRLALSTAAPSAHGSTMGVVSAPVLDCNGDVVLDGFGNPVTISALNVIITPADLVQVLDTQFPDAPGDPVTLYYALQMTDLEPFTRRWLFGPFTIIPE